MNFMAESIFHQKEIPRCLCEVLINILHICKTLAINIATLTMLHVTVHSVNRQASKGKIFCPAQCPLVSSCSNIASSIEDFASFARLVLKM